jgi:hypothetical protein
VWTDVRLAVVGTGGRILFLFHIQKCIHRSRVFAELEQNSGLLGFWTLCSKELNFSETGSVSED